MNALRVRRLPLAILVPLLAVVLAAALTAFAPKLVIAFGYGGLAIGSGFMVCSWAGVAWSFLGDDRPMRSKRFLVAYGLVNHASVMAGITAFRCIDVGRDAPVMGSDVAVLSGALSGLFLSKAIFVWAAALPDEAMRTPRWPWPAFMLSLLLLAVGLVATIGLS